MKYFIWGLLALTGIGAVALAFYLLYSLIQNNNMQTQAEIMNLESQQQSSGGGLLGSLFNGLSSVIPFL